MSNEEAPKKECILFCDLETTGLSVESNEIIEIACVLTDTDLNELSNFHRVILPSCCGEGAELSVSDLYESAHPIVQQMHTDNRLWKDLQEPFAVSTTEAGYDATAWLKACFVEYDLAPPLLGGASVHFDRKFLEVDFSWLAALLHHRNFDVSTLKRMFEWWLGFPVPKLPQDEAARHRAMPDIRYTIAEAAWIRKRLVLK